MILQRRRPISALQIKQRGFSLVEIAIVVVVIGLILGGVLGGQQVISNARIKATVSDFQAYQAAFQTYVQNFRAVPGDDTQATTRFSDVSVPGNGNGDGVVGVRDTLTQTFNSTADIVNGNATAESRLVWSHLRAGKLIKGSGSSAIQPTNAYNGLFGIQSGAFVDGLPLGTTVICANNIGGDAALAIDGQLDDGQPNTGQMRGGSGSTAGALATNYVSGTNYTLCTSL